MYRAGREDSSEDPNRSAFAITPCAGFRRVLLGAKVGEFPWALQKRVFRDGAATTAIPDGGVPGNSLRQPMTAGHGANSVEESREVGKSSR
jgi:hypothetical protein